MPPHSAWAPPSSPAPDVSQHSTGQAAAGSWRSPWRWGSRDCETPSGVETDEEEEEEEEREDAEEEEEEEVEDNETIQEESQGVSQSQPQAEEQT